MDSNPPADAQYRIIDVFIGPDGEGKPSPLIKVEMPNGEQLCKTTQESQNWYLVFSKSSGLKLVVKEEGF